MKKKMKMISGITPQKYLRYLHDDISSIPEPVPDY